MSPGVVTSARRGGTCHMRGGITVAACLFVPLRSEVAMSDQSTDPDI